MTKFAIAKIDGGLRFQASDGWIDLMLIDDHRANIWCGTFNETPAEVFGARLWHLLHDAMPDLELRAVAYEGEADPFVERILAAAGFAKEGTRRSWGASGQDWVLYSILASEVLYEVREANGHTNETGMAPTANPDSEVSHG